MEGTPRSRIGRRLFWAFALLYVLTVHGRYFSDDVFHFEQVQVFVESGALAMSPARDPEALGGAGAFMRPGVDGRVYLTLPPGLALAASPLGWLGHTLGFPNPPPEQPMEHTASPATTFWASLTMPLVMAGAVWAFFLLVVHTSGSIRRGMAGAVVFGLATSTWFFATTFWTQPLATACFLGAVTCLVVGTRPIASALAAGALVGFAVATRFDFAIFVPWFFVLVATARPTKVRRLAAFALPLAVFAAALVAWNHFRFGDMLETRSLHQGTAPFRVELWPASLPTMLFGLDQGLLVYSPAVLLGVFGIRRCWRAHRALTTFVVGTVVTMVLVYGAFVFWSTPSPTSWGNRFLYPVIPFCLLLAFMPRDRDPLRSLAARALVGVSGIMALAGIAQRVRLGPPTWWVDDPARALAAAMLFGALVWVVVRLRRDWARST